MQALQRRLDALEGISDLEAAALATGAAPARPDPIVVLSLIGRVLVVLAGGFFLRTLTDTGALAPMVGVAAGFAYGLLWLALADRAGRRLQTLNAVFHAVAAAMVAFPLLVEATTRFNVSSGTTSAIALSVLTAGLLFVAWRRRLHAVAWVTVVAALPTSVVILVQTSVVVPFAFFLIAFGVATLWLGYDLEWRALRWPVALSADLVVFGVTTRALAPEPRDPANIAMLVQLSLLGAYVVSIAIRTLVRGRNVIPFEVAQTIAALLVGFGGAIALSRADEAISMRLGAASLILAVACYAVAFAFLDRRLHHGRNVYFYTTLAFVLMLAGLTLVLGEPGRGVAIAVLAVAAAGLWSRRGRLFMLLHGAAYLVAAGVASGALAYCVGTLVAGFNSPWAPPGMVTLAVLAAGVLSVALATVQPESAVTPFASWPRFVIILVFVWIAGGCAVGYLAPIAGGISNGAVDLGGLATVRTGVLAAATLLVAWISRRAGFREWGWLVYPLLIGIGLKMMAQDFRYSHSTTLFIAMALYGAALIFAPRLRHSSHPRHG